jgi:hypothetical protein
MGRRLWAFKEGPSTTLRMTRKKESDPTIRSSGLMIRREGILTFHREIGSSFFIVFLTKKQNQKSILERGRLVFVTFG